jgi:hypothetical protein
MSKKVILVGIVAAASLYPAPPARAEGRIRERQENQQQRIAQGVASGRLTAAETARLERREAALNREVHGMRQVSGGSLTAAERGLVEHQQNRLSRQIYRQKHDGQTRH